MARVRQLALGGALACLLAAALPGPAAAGTADVRFYQVVSRSGEPVSVARIVYRAGLGEHNALSVAVQGSTATISDPAGVTPGPGCSLPDPTRREVARCSLGAATAADLRVSLGDRSDAADVSGELPTNNSAYLGGDVVIAGGRGRDGLSAGSASGVLSGGPGSDRLRAGTGPVEFRGGSGNDRMIGGPSDDRFEEGRFRNGHDLMLGGRGEDLVDYGARRRSVRADLRGDPDDGGRGERDLVGANVEHLAGGAGADRLVGNSRSNRLSGGRERDRLAGRGGADVLAGGRGGDRLAGGSGQDLLYGSGGGDRIHGGAGRDQAFAGPGPDRVVLRDGGLDEVECGSGRERLSLDGLDWFSNPSGGRCERVRRSRPPAAVYLGHREVDVHASESLAIPTMACPGDFPGRCMGRVQLLVEGREVGSAGFSVGRSRFEHLRVPLDPAVWRRTRESPPVPATLVVRVQDARGHAVTRSTAVELR